MLDLRGCFNMRRRSGFQRGFTLIELLLVMGLLAIVGIITSINLIKPQTAATLGATADTLVADLRAQQLKAMTGNSASGSVAEPFSLLVANDHYTTYSGTYNASSPDNFVTMTESGVRLTTTFPAATITFAKGTGELTNFSAGVNTITLTNTNSGETTTIQLNRLGVVTVN